MPDSPIAQLAALVGALRDDDFAKALADIDRRERDLAAEKKAFEEVQKTIRMAGREAKVIKDSQDEFNKWRDTEQKRLDDELGRAKTATKNAKATESALKAERKAFGEEMEAKRAEFDKTRKAAERVLKDREAAKAALEEAEGMKAAYEAKLASLGLKEVA